MSDDNIIIFDTAKNHVWADAVLEQGKGTFEDVILLGWDKEGSLRIVGSGDLRERTDLVYILMKVVNSILNGEFDDA